MGGVDHSLFVVRVKGRRRRVVVLGWLIVLGILVAQAATSDVLSLGGKITLVAIAGGLWTLFTYLMFIRPLVQVCADELRIRQPLGSLVIRFEEVRSADGGLLLTIHLNDGTIKRIWAAQNSRLTEFRGVWGDADEAARQINLAVEQWRVAR